jgi:hypothetical protein
MGSIMLPTITMDCPVCLQSNRIGILQINKTVRCGACKSEFEATPDGRERDIIRLPWACSVTKQMFILVFERQQPPQKKQLCGHTPRPGQAGYSLIIRPSYRMVATFTPKGGSSGEGIKTREIKVEEFNFSDLSCPCCHSKAFDYCSQQHFICEGAAKRLTKGGVENYCPYCATTHTYNVPMEKVDVYAPRPMQNVSVPPNSPKTWVKRLELGSSSSIVRKT